MISTHMISINGLPNNEAGAGNPNEAGAINECHAQAKNGGLIKIN